MPLVSLVFFVVLLPSLFLSQGFADPALGVLRKGTIVDRRVLGGELIAERKIEIRTPMVSWNIADKLTIAEIPEDGTSIHKGETVLRFEESIIQDKHTNAVSEHNVALAELRQEESNQELERINLELEVRRKEMELEKAKLGVLKGELLSEVEREKARLDQEAVRLELELAREKLAKYAEKRRNALQVKQLVLAQKKKEMEDIAEILANLAVPAPEEGITYRPFSELNWSKGKAERGKAVRSGDLVLELPDMNSFQVVVYAHPADVAAFKVGDAASSTVLAVPELVLQGTVQRIDSFVTTRKERLGVEGAEGNLTEVRMVVALAAQDPRLRPGMTTRTEVRATVAEDVLIVPLVAVAEEKDRRFVRLSSGEARTVKLGRTGLFEAEVLEGLAPGDTVLLDAQTK
ncbi:MAG: hypothetical protein A2284_17380 [Deltaproteobacteria bacterium RIFOXYA12_FULL_61_11]|nr:MAG: hypothetical protein A2284_17380 [Deltaproteobacteria bacterium RIFOXYA12_FULL_61_11]